MSKVTEAALRRKPDEQVLDRSKSSSPTISMSAGAREIYRRTHWSASLCNAVAVAWSFGQVEA